MYADNPSEFSLADSREPEVEVLVDTAWHAHHKDEDAAFEDRIALIGHCASLLTITCCRTDRPPMKTTRLDVVLHAAADEATEVTWGQDWSLMVKDLDNVGMRPKSSSELKCDLPRFVWMVNNLLMAAVAYYTAPFFINQNSGEILCVPI